MIAELSHELPQEGFVAKMRNVMRDPYDPAVFINQVQEWGQRAIAAGTLTDEQRAFFDQQPASD